MYNPGIAASLLTCRPNLLSQWHRQLKLLASERNCLPAWSWRQWVEHRAGIGRYAARGWWFLGFKLVLTATLDLLPDQAVLIPAAGAERDAAAALLRPDLVLIGDRNFCRYTSPTWRAELDHAGTTVVVPPPRRHAANQDPTERAFLRHIRNRIETLIGLLKGEHGLEDHGARSWWGLLTRLTGVLAAFTLARYCLHFGLA